MKIATVLGTRPEIIRLSRIITKLDTLCEQVIVHTGQNFSNRLSEIFFEELGVRSPNYKLGVRGTSIGEQVAQILVECERVFAAEQPDRLLILGDTNSALCAIVAKRSGIPVFHMEAGNRCFDDRVPEEVNRRIIDHASDVLMPYTERSRANLLREGFAGESVFVVGNPIFEVIEHYRDNWQNSQILPHLNLTPKGYFLVTLHRAENVDDEARLRAFAGAFSRLAKTYNIPVIVSTHPRTRDRMDRAGIKADGQVVYPEPFGFFDFIALERQARCVLSDSGTVQEECSIFGVPNVTLRDVTERPETLECGSNILSGAREEDILACVRTVLEFPSRWQPPSEYLLGDVSGTVCRIVLGYHHRLGGL